MLQVIGETESLKNAIKNIVVHENHLFKLHEQYKKMNMLVDFQYFMEFIDNLGLDIEAHFEKQAQTDEPDIYSLNGENIFVEFKNEVRPQYASIFEPKNNKLPTLIA